MDYAQFSELAHTTVANLLDRIPAKYCEGLESLLFGGELRLAVEELLATLVDDRVPVTPAERDDVRRLLEHLKAPTDELDGLNVVSPE